MSIIKVHYDVYSNKWHITKALASLSKEELLGFDTETSGVYSKKERKIALEYLKEKDIPLSYKRLALQVAANSGLSFPSLVKVTHFIFGISESRSVVLVCTTPELEMFIWNWIANYQGILLVHNALFDLKIMYHRTKKFPLHYEDTQLLAKCLTNNAQVWKSKVGLKDLMGSYYDPAWAAVDEYEPLNPKDPKFLLYAATDGAAVIKLWHDIKEHIWGAENEGS